MKASAPHKRPRSSMKELPDLLRQAENGNSLARAEALESLSGIEHPSVLQAMVKGLSDRAPIVRVTAAESLGTLRNKKGASHLLSKLKDSNGEVRMRAAESLGTLLEDGNSPRPLIKLLQDTDELVKIAAAEALGRIGDRKALPALRKAINDPSPLVRSYVAEAVGKLGSGRDVERLEKLSEKETSGAAKVGLYQALYMLGRRAVLNNLVELLQSDDYKVRCATANTLCILGADGSDASLILRSMRKALRKEQTVAARSSLRSSLRTMGR